MTTFYIEQFGCRATQADGAAIERQLREQGYRMVAQASAADVVVLNTCTVTAAADTQARDAIRKIHVASPATRIIVTGCYAQRAPDELAALPGVTHVVGNSHKTQIPALVDTIRAKPGISAASGLLPLTALQTGLPVAEAATARILTGDIFDLSEILAAPVLGGEGSHTRPILKIQDGCNSRCSFCVIPFVRGRSRSLAPGKVVAEIQRLAEAGYREIVLSGINLGTYGRDLTPRVEFLELLRQILGETSLERVRVSSVEPLDVTRDLVELFASTRRLAPHFHMPLQSAADRILAAMHRWYRAEHYARRVEIIRERLPHAAIGADVITGFPGETEEDHACTLRFIEQRGFTYLHVFSYSRRPGTKADLLPNQIVGSVIKRRARELRELAKEKSAEFFRSQAGRTLRFLTLRRGAKDDPCRTPAISENFLTLELPFVLSPNQFVDATVGQEGDANLAGLPAAAALTTT